ncbi:hypothetical protein [Methylobacterium sp. 190mf]|uniref:hypothetical protein n=1 Tax=Methylobacterium sp. 190mf TaxID=1761798 RepID=UPI0011B09585|nr:hypothetical protein [Methylobacterium sp. 190mf]
MQALDGTAYDAHAVWERMLNPVAAEVRTATDRPFPFVSNQGRSAPEQFLAPNKAATDAASEQSDMIAAGLSTLHDGSAFFDPWFSRTMGILADARVPSELDAAQHQELIGTAEMLAAFLVEIDPAVRPQLMVDEDGNASYGTSIDGFYLNLTIDSPGKITWYAVVNDKEHFGEGASFSGRRLPEPLRDLFQLSPA